ISKIKVKETVEASRTVFEVNGQLFFASVEDFIGAFDFTVKNETIVIDFSNAHIWDDSGVGAVDQAIMKYRENNNQVEITDSINPVKKLSINSKCMTFPRRNNNV